MRIYYMSLVLIFAIGCSGSRPVAPAKGEETKEKETAITAETETTEKETRKETEITKTAKQSKPAAGQTESKDGRIEEELMEEISGLIIEETMTKIGYEFYEYFFLLWEAPEVGVKDYNIFINERASPLWGSWVRVNVDGTTVWNRVLRPRSEEIEDAVKQAIEATKQYFYNYEQYQFQTEDMVGTGI